MSINFKNVDYIYQQKTPFSHLSLKNINVEIKDGSFTAIIGQTGSGKSTFIQHINGLLLPSNGTVTVLEQEITSKTKNKDLVELRKKVGLVFQFPESQLFAETVIDDVMFGPINFGMSPEMARNNAEKALNQVGITKDLWQHSPFELSGGQRRRVAIAGVIATQPKILILDEPTSGLDPKGQTEIMNLFMNLHQNLQMTIVLVTHQMEDVAKFAERVLVMEDGMIIRDTNPQKLFANTEFLDLHHLQYPQATSFAKDLIQKGVRFSRIPITEDDLNKQLIEMLRGGQTHE